MSYSRAGTARGLQDAFSGVGSTLMAISQDRERREEMERQREMEESRLGLAHRQDERAGEAHEANLANMEWQRQAQERAESQGVRDRAMGYRMQGMDARAVDPPEPGLVNPRGAPRSDDVPGYGAALQRVTDSANPRPRPPTLAVGSEWNPDRDVGLQRQLATRDHQTEAQLRLERDRDARRPGGATPPPGAAVSNLARSLLGAHGNDPSAAMQDLVSREDIDDDMKREVQLELMEIQNRFWDFETGLSGGAQAPRQNPFDMILGGGDGGTGTGLRVPRSGLVADPEPTPRGWHPPMADPEIHGEPPRLEPGGSQEEEREEERGISSPEEVPEEFRAIHPSLIEHGAPEDIVEAYREFRRGTGG
jgi:hypothetical protein